MYRLRISTLNEIHRICGVGFTEDEERCKPEPRTALGRWLGMLVGGRSTDELESCHLSIAIVFN